MLLVHVQLRHVLRFTSVGNHLKPSWNKFDIFLRRITKKHLRSQKVANRNSVKVKFDAL